MSRPDPYFSYDGWKLWSPTDDSIECDRCGSYVNPENITDGTCEDCLSRIDETLTWL